MNYELKFDPKTIEHLGVKMYATLPPALAELISNAYDADASFVEVSFYQKNGSPISISVKDDGSGMSVNDIQNKFLVIGRNRRQDVGDEPSPKFKRLSTGKKGLGKLALFGLAKQIVLDTCKEGKRNRFKMNWDELLDSNSVYKPQSDIQDEKTDRPNGTLITLEDLKRKSPFDLESTADSLARIFIVDSNFKIVLKKTGGQKVEVTNERRYQQIDKEFTWMKNDLELEEYILANDLQFTLITGKTPIKPSSGLRGVTIFSRGKLVNAPEYFSDSTSSNFYQYLTGWIQADFIDLLDEDVISTNRQSINWEHPEMSKLRDWLRHVISRVNISWREKRKEKKDYVFKEATGIDKEEWFSKLPGNIKKSAEVIVNTLSNDDGVNESFNPVVMALHEIIPEYPLLHWRHLHSEIKDRVGKYYQNGQFAEAAQEGVKIYAHLVRSLSGSADDGVKLAGVFSAGNEKSTNLPIVQIADISTHSGRNIQFGQDHMTRGMMAGFRNPLAHEPLDKVVPGTFSELDCLNILSLISYLTTRLDFATINHPKA